MPHVIASVLERTPRSEAFSAGEDLALAGTWISATNEIDDKRQSEFWNEVARTHNTQPETEGKQVRSSKSTRSRFNTLQGIAQKYISADKIYRATPRSGETQEDVRRSVMHLYRTKTPPQILQTEHSLLLPQ
jgi:hypothetical protein